MNDQQLLRYSRHITLPEIDINGQQKLIQSKVMIIGLGGIGTATAMYLAASGIGHLSLVDHDTISLHNLQRQLLYNINHLDKSKVKTAEQQLPKYNPDLTIHTHCQQFSTKLITTINYQYDAILIATDNFASRYLINTACHQHKIPMINAAAIGFKAQLTNFNFTKENTACYNCLFPEQQSTIAETQSCTQTGVLSPLVGFIGCLQAIETIKLITGLSMLHNTLWTFDALTFTNKQIKFNQDPNCPTCNNVSLTGITTTGEPHLGNYIGAIRPAIKASNDSNYQSFFFLADYHALIKCHDPTTIQQSILTIAATWLACGLNPQTVIFYRQSDIPEITQLNWILTCQTAKGLINRAHAYKSATDNNITLHQDPDKAITMGLYSYPILMAADILTFDANQVPVGTDQIQHIEMARDIANRFNHHYGKHFNLPTAITNYPGLPTTSILIGLDGRKMSKSYHNTIPLFCAEKKLLKLINKITTNSQLPSEPKDYNNCNLFNLYQAFATQEEIHTIKQRYHQGIAWGEMKQILFNCINNEIKHFRDKYQQLIQQPDYLKQLLLQGATKAREIAKQKLNIIQQAIGLKI